MKKESKKQDSSPAVRKNPSASGRQNNAEGACRCKEISKKTVPELLRTMIDDLSLRKKKE